MARARLYFERKALAKKLKTTLNDNNWDIPINEGFFSEEPLVNPQVTVELLDLGPLNFQLGKEPDKVFIRVAQIDLYLENEQRVEALCDLIMDFMTDVPIYIYDMDGVTIIGTLICQNDESISSTFHRLDIADAKLLRYRGIIRGTYEAHYPNG